MLNKKRRTMKTMKKVLTLVTLLTFIIFSCNNLLAKDKPNDKEISNAVDNELLYNATTPSYLIDVSSNDGIVTLRGSVNNILAQDRAVKIARTVKGVRAVINKIEVDAPLRADGVLENVVRNALLLDPATDSYEIDVTAENGIVSLSGIVESWQEKQISEYVVKGIVGVKKVDNNIAFVYKRERPDYEIKTDIEQALKNDIRIDDSLIEVTVQNGEVNLLGVVGSANEKSQAYVQAWVTGVNEVSNADLDVQEWARNENLRKDKYVSRSDEEIAEAVKDAFVYDPRVFSFNPEISVENGVVTLNGMVSNLKAKRAAVQNAKNVVGVHRVKDYLKVRPVFIPLDNDLSASVTNALVKNPELEKWKIEVTANHGVVYLNGAVDSYFQKSKAEDIASKTKGVIAVENNLKISDDNDYYFNTYYGWNSYYPPYQIDVASNYQPDESIQENIIDELWWSPYVNEDEVNVVVQNGTAKLDGVVDTRREKLYAEINALEGGAVKVENNLQVNYLADE
jgi:osmotically-inducible protein OsmY